MEKDYKTAERGASVEVTLRSYLDKAGLRQVLDAVGRRVDGAEGFPEFCFPGEEFNLEPLAYETVVEPEKVVWDEVTENFYGLSSEGVYYERWPGWENWMDPETGEARRDRLFLIPSTVNDNSEGLYLFLNSMLPTKVWPPEKPVSDGVSYWICPSVGAVAKSAQPTFRTTKISAKAYKSTGASVSEFTGGSMTIEGLDKAGNLYVNMAISGLKPGEEVALDDFYTNSNELMNDIQRVGTHYFRFVLFDEAGKEVASCTVPVVLDGAKGKDGADGKDGEDGSSFSANLMAGTAGRIEGTFDAAGDNMIIKRECAVHMIQGETYTVSARTNASGFISDPLSVGPGSEGCALLLCHSEHGAAPGYWETVSAPEMATDGTTGRTLVWNKPTGDYYLRVNFYLAGTWWAEKVKVERGAVARPQWTPSEDEMNPSAKIAALEARVANLEKDLDTHRVVIQQLRDNVAELQAQFE